MMADAYNHPPPSTGERYASATESSNLLVRHERGDADFLIMAGWLPDFLGGTLFRLRTEFDAASASLPPGVTMNLTEQLLILQRLRSLREAKDALGRYAEWLATKRGFMANPQAVAALVGRTLVAFLNPLCPHCEGRGFNGGGRHEHSGPQIICRACRGTGDHRQGPGRSPEEIDFVQALLTAMGEQMANAESGIKRNREGVQVAKDAIEQSLKAERVARRS